MIKKNVVHYIDRRTGHYACNQACSTALNRSTKIWFLVNCKNCIKADPTLDKKQNLATVAIVMGFFVLTASLLFREHYADKTLYGIVCIVSFIMIILGIVNFNISRGGIKQ